MKKSKKKKIIIIIAVIAVIGALGFAAYNFLIPKEPQGLPVTAGAARMSEIEEVVSIKGVVEGSEKAEISSTTDLEVISINVKEGDKVKKGQVLANLDGSTITADYNKAVNTLEQSKYQYETAKTLYAEGAIPLDDLKKAQTAFDNDAINVNTYDKMDQTMVKSPITGTVTRINTSQGRAANDTKDKDPMFVVEDLENLQMNVKISEYDISKILIGQSVEIAADVLGEETVTGTVSKISPTGETKSPTESEMVIPVTIDVNEGGTGLIAGVSAKAKILIQRRDQTLVVPVDAILIDPGTEEASVLTIKKNVIKKVPVTLGIEGNLETEVISDVLKEGDSLVLAPTFDMVDGTQVVIPPTE